MRLAALITFLAFALQAGISAIIVTIPPQIEAAKAIAGNDVQILSIVPSGSIPENYMPTPKQMIAFEKASLYVTIGAPFEKKILPKLQKSLPKLKIIDGSKGMKLREMTEEHHHHGDHEHETHDPHVWLSIENMRQFTKNVADALCIEEPAKAAVFRERQNSYFKKLDALKNETSQRLAPFKGRVLLVNHPAFGYFADDFGLKQIAIEKEGKTAGAKHLAEISMQIAAIHATVLFVQPQFNRQTCEQIAKTHNLKIVVLDPLPSEYINGMKRIAETIEINMSERLSGAHKKAQPE